MPNPEVGSLHLASLTNQTLIAIYTLKSLTCQDLTLYFTMMTFDTS